MALSASSSSSLFSFFLPVRCSLFRVFTVGLLLFLVLSIFVFSPFSPSLSSSSSSSLSELSFRSMTVSSSRAVKRYREPEQQPSVLVTVPDSSLRRSPVSPVFPVVDFSRPIDAAMRDWEKSYKIADLRGETCETRQHDNDKYYENKFKDARVAIIIPSYHDTKYHLVRTVASLITHTPPELLAQIIIVDDANEVPMVLDLSSSVTPGPSDPPDMPTWDPSLPPPHYDFLTILRLPKHEGLSVAKNKGARLAIEAWNATHLVFLEAHCDAQPGWLPPLLSLLAVEPNTVAVPVVDMLEWQGADSKTMVYQPVHAYMGGLFGWDLIFQWVMPKNSTNDASVNFHSASLSGGLYAVTATMYSAILMLDDGLTGWGAENVELSIKAWNCASGIRIVPCSRIGHLFRKSFPYSVDRRPLVANMARVFLVWIGSEWMDVFLKHYSDMRSQILHASAIFDLQKAGKTDEAERLLAKTSRSDVPFINAVLTGLLSRYELARQCRPFESFLDTQLPSLRTEAATKREEDRKAKAEAEKLRPTKKDRGPEHVTDADREVAKYMGYPKPTTTPGQSASLLPHKCKQQRVLCVLVVRSDPDGVEQVRAVFDTWGKHCAGILLFGNGEVPDGSHDLPYVSSSLVPKEDTWSNLLTRIKFAIDTASECFFESPSSSSLSNPALVEICQQVWLRPDVRSSLSSHQPDARPEFDWLFKADDDTFVLQDNLCNMLDELSELSKVRPMWLGRRFRYPVLLPSSAPMPAVYYTSGSGYILNPSATSRLAVALRNSASSVCGGLLRDFGASYPEDLSMGACLETAGVDAYDTRDPVTLQQRFHPFMPALTTQVVAADTWLAQYDRDPVPLRLVKPIEVIASTSVLFHSVKSPTYMRELHRLFTTETVAESVEAVQSMQSVAPSSDCPAMLKLYDTLVSERLADFTVLQEAKIPVTLTKNVNQQQLQQQQQRVSSRYGELGVAEARSYIASIQSIPVSSCAHARALVYNFDKNFQNLGAALSDVIEAFSFAAATRRIFVFKSHKSEDGQYPFLYSNCTDDPSLPLDASTFECLFQVRMTTSCTESSLAITPADLVPDAAAGQSEARVVYNHVPDRQWRSHAAFREGLCDKVHSWPHAQTYADTVYPTSGVVAAAAAPPSFSSPSSLDYAIWRSSLYHAFSHPTVIGVRELADAKLRMGWPSCEPVIGLHVVRGAKLGSDGNTIPLSTYIKEAIDIADRYSVRYLYLSADDNVVRSEWSMHREASRRFRLLFDPSTVRQANFALYGLPGRRPPGHSFESGDEGQLALNEINLLAECDFLVGAFASFTFRQAWLAKAAKRNFQVHSIEDNKMYPETCIQQIF